MKSLCLEKEFKTIVMLLATQAMIHLGTVNDPLLREKKADRQRADVFIGLLEILQEKTSGNLHRDENIFLKDIVENLQTIYNEKSKSGL